MITREKGSGGKGGQEVAALILTEIMAFLYD